jgi:hypothetical protein
MSAWEDEVRARVDAATPGPWWTVNSPDGDGHCLVYDNAQPDRQMVAALGARCPDAEFLAAARSDVPRLLDAIAAVRALHRPIEVEAVAWACLLGDCEHGDLNECPPFPMTACAACDALMDEHVGSDERAYIAWPCPTIRALDGGEG